MPDTAFTLIDVDGCVVKQSVIVMNHAQLFAGLPVQMIRLDDADLFAERLVIIDIRDVSELEYAGLWVVR